MTPDPPPCPAARLQPDRAPRKSKRNGPVPHSPRRATAPSKTLSGHYREQTPSFTRTVRADPGRVLQHVRPDVQRLRIEAAQRRAHIPGRLPRDLLGLEYLYERGARHLRRPAGASHRFREITPHRRSAGHARIPMRRGAGCRSAGPSAGRSGAGSANTRSRRTRESFR